MTDNWQQYIDRLNGYIQSHPEIQIGRYSTSIPDKIRPEFYGLFKQAREELVKDKYSDLLKEALLLSQNYIEIEHKVSRAHYNSNDRDIILQKGNTKKNTAGLWHKLIGLFHPGGFKLDGILLDANLDEFLHEPLNAFTRVCFDPLFDLLQGKIDLGMFEKTVDEKLKAEFRKLYRLGYEKWLILNLLRLVETDSLFKVVSDEISAKALVKQQASVNEMNVKASPPQKTDILAFISSSRNTHTLSNVDLLLHSRSLNKYIGIKAKYETAAFNIAAAPTQRPSLPFESAREALMNSSILIYISDDAQDASLVADKKRFWRPDLIMDIETSTESMPDTFIHDTLRPMLGTFVIPSPLSARKPEDNIKPDVSVLNVGFEASRLNYIVNKIT